MTGTDANQFTTMGGATPWPSPVRAWYALGIMTVSIIFSFIDRGILPLLVIPIIQELKLTYTQVSILMGFAFMCFYAILSFPVARLVDRMSRRLILGVGIVLWSTMTGISGMAQNFWQFFLIRMGIGVGEACNGPAVYSLLSDFFPREKLPKALAVLNLGTMLGNGIALLVGGTIIGLLTRLPEVTLPVIGVVKPWQMTFFVVGFPGLIIAALIATIKEPARQGILKRKVDDRVGVREDNVMSVKDVARYLYLYRRAYAPMYLALAIQTVMINGIIIWLPTFFIVHHGWTIEKYGQLMGFIFILISPVGLMAGGFLAEWLTKKGYADANLRVVTISAIITLPFLVLAPLMSDPYIAVGLLAGQNLFAGMAMGPQNAAFQVITPNQIRGQVTALYLIIINILGFGLGPLFITFIAVQILGGFEMFGLAMALAGLVMQTLAIIVFWRGMKPYGQRYEETQRQLATSN